MQINTTPPYLIKKWMDFWGFKGLAMPFTDTIYFRTPEDVTDKLLKHEKKHLEQMKRDGTVWFLIKYNWYWLTVGYVKNVYETEARKAEDEIK